MDITPFILISSLAMPVGAYDKVQGTRDDSILCIQYIERFSHFDLYGVVDNTARLYHFHFYLLGFQPPYTNEKQMKSKNIIHHHHCKNSLIKVTH